MMIETFIIGVSLTLPPEMVSDPAAKPLAALQPAAAATSKVTAYVPTAEGGVSLSPYFTVIVPVVLPSFAVTVTVLGLPS